MAHDELALMAGEGGAVAHGEGGSWLTAKLHGDGARWLTAGVARWLTAKMALEARDVDHGIGERPEVLITACWPGMVSRSTRSGDGRGSGGGRQPGVPQHDLVPVAVAVVGRGGLLPLPPPLGKPGLLPLLLSMVCCWGLPPAYRGKPGSVESWCPDGAGGGWSPRADAAAVRSVLWLVSP